MNHTMFHTSDCLYRAKQKKRHQSNKHCFCLRLVRASENSKMLKHKLIMQDMRDVKVKAYLNNKGTSIQSKYLPTNKGTVISLRPSPSLLPLLLSALNSLSTSSMHIIVLIICFLLGLRLLPPHFFFNIDIMQRSLLALLQFRVRKGN